MCMFVCVASWQCLQQVEVAVRCCTSRKGVPRQC